MPPAPFKQVLGREGCNEGDPSPYHRLVRLSEPGSESRDNQQLLPEEWRPLEHGLGKAMLQAGQNQVCM